MGGGGVIYFSGEFVDFSWEFRFCPGEFRYFLGVFSGKGLTNIFHSITHIGKLVVYKYARQTPVVMQSMCSL